MELQEIEQQIRYTLRESTAAFFTSAEITAWANEGQNVLCNELPTSLLYELATGPVSIATVADQDSYDLPGDYLSMTAILLFGYPCTMLRREQWDYLTKQNVNFKPSDSFPFATTFGSKLTVAPTPASADDNGIKLYHIKAPTALAQSSDVPEVPTATHHMLVWYGVSKGHEKDLNREEAAHFRGLFDAELKNLNTLYG